MMSLLALCLAAPVLAQIVSPGLEHANPEMNRGPAREVQQRVEEFLLLLGKRDVAGVKRLLAPSALVAVVRQQRDGSVTNSYQTAAEFVAALEKNTGQPPFEEPLTNVTVTVESGRLAHLRADFTIVRDGTIVSSGVDHFTLIKEADGWKIAMLAYTSHPHP